MPRYVKIILSGFGAMLILLVAGTIVLLTFNWNNARPWVGRQVGSLVDRSVAIQGDLSLHWRRPADEPGWRGWVPWPQVNAEQVVVGNPSWGPQGTDMVVARHVSAVFNPWALWQHRVQISDLKLDFADISLLRGTDGRNNWSLQKDADAPHSRWTFDVQKVALRKVQVQVRDASHQLDVKTELNSLDGTASDGYGLSWTTSGTYNKASVAGTGQSGRILSLQQGTEPFPLSGDIKVGETLISIQGSLTRPQDLAAIDVRLRLEGATMADLYPLVGLILPNTPPYSTEGRLVGVLDTDEDKWTYKDFKGKVGSSDLQGTLEYLVRKPRSLLTGQVQSKLLRFQDLGPLIGVKSSEAKNPPKRKAKEDPENAAAEKKQGDVHTKGSRPDAERAHKSVQQPAGKALPVQPIDTDMWSKMDADVQFTGHKILHDKDLPLDKVKAHVILSDSVLKLDPLNFGVAGGNLNSKIELNGQGETIKAKMTISARHLKLKQLLPAARSMNASFGEVHGDAALSGEGDSIAELLGHSNGELQALVSKGTISHLLLETAGLNLANIIIVKLFGDEQVTMNCLVSDFSVKNGVMTARTFVLDTEDAVVTITGKINLATEKFELDIKPENKSLRIFTLRTPLYVKGTFKNPDVGVYKGPLAARAGAAVALGIIATPFAALLPLLNMGTNDSNECAPAPADARGKLKAAPEKAKKPESKQKERAR